MTLLDSNSNLEVERRASEVGLISDPRFSIISKTSKRKSQLSFIEEDIKNKNNYSFDKTILLEKLCKPSKAPQLDVPPTPPKQVDEAALRNKEPSVLKLPPLQLQKEEKKLQDKSQPALPALPPLPQKAIPNLPHQANEGLSLIKENIFIVPSLYEKKSLAPLKEPATVHPPPKSLLPLPPPPPPTLQPQPPLPAIGLPVKESSSFPKKKAPVPPTCKGNTFPLPRKENAFQLPTPTKDGPKRLTNKDNISRSSSAKFHHSLSKNTLKFPSFKEEQVKDTLKSLLSKENHSKPVVTDEQSTSKRDGFKFSRLKEAKFKLLQGNNVKEQQRSNSSHPSRIPTLFNEGNMMSKPTTSKTNLLEDLSTDKDMDKPHTKDDDIKQHQYNDSLESAPKDQSGESSAVKAGLKKTIYRKKGPAKDGTVSSLFKKTQYVRPPTPSKTFEPSLSNVNLQKSLANDTPRPPTPLKECSTPLKEISAPLIKSSTSLIETSVPLEEPPVPSKESPKALKTTAKPSGLKVSARKKPVDLSIKIPSQTEDKDLNRSNIRKTPSLPNTTEPNTPLGHGKSKPPVPKRNLLKTEIPKVESSKQISLNDVSETLNSSIGQDTALTTTTATPLDEKKTIRGGLRLGPQTNDTCKSKEKLPKPTSVFSNIKPFNSEKEITSPKNDAPKRKLIKQTTIPDTNIVSPSNAPSNAKNFAIDNSSRPPTPKKDCLITSPRSKAATPKYRPPIPQRELPVLSPKGDKKKEKNQLPSIELKSPPPPPKKSLPNTVLIANVINESSSSSSLKDLTRPLTPKKDTRYLSDFSNQSRAMSKFSDRKRLNKLPPPPPLIINKDILPLPKLTANPYKEKDDTPKQLILKENIFKLPLPQKDFNISTPYKSILPVPAKNMDNKIPPTPRDIINDLPVLPPKTFLPDIAPPPPPKKNKLPPPIHRIPFNPARNKRLIPIPEPIRLSLEEDYPNKTVNPDDIFHVEYRERTHFRGVQWCFDEFSGIYHKKIPGLHQSLPHFQMTMEKSLQRSQTTVKTKKAYRTRSRLSLSRHKEPVYDDTEDIKWTTPTSVDEVHLMRKKSRKLRDNKAQLTLCRVLIEATSTGKDEFGSMGPYITTKYSPKELRKKKKKDLVFDEVLILETQKLLNDLVVGKHGDFPDSEAQFLLANCYGIGGLGFPLDRERAFELYIHASKQNHVESIYRAGVCYELGIGTNQDNNRAMSFFRKAAIHAHVPSMYKLGIILLRGYCGQTKNIREALSWLQRAAASSSSENPHALYALAMLQLDEGCPDTNLIADSAYAIDLLHESAKLEYAPSQVKLGELYEAGNYVAADDALSIYWYTRAAEAGNADAALALSCWYLTGSLGILEQSDQEAFLWAYKAATSKTADRWTVAKAMFLVGVYIEQGVTSSSEDAKAWFRRAAALGHKGAVEKMKNENLKAICNTE